MDYQFLQKTPLFSDSSIDEIKSMLNCLEAEKKKFAKGDVIYRAGDTVQSMGLVLSGRVQIENDDLWGNKSVLDSIAPGHGLCGNLCFPSRRTSHGQRRCLRTFRNPVFKRSTDSAVLSQCLYPPQQIDPPPPDHILTKKPESFQTDFPYLRQNHPRTPGILPLRPGCAIPKPGLHDPL